jgi:hypothetical protein
MYFPPFRARLPRRFLTESLAADRLSWIAGFDIEKHVSALHIFADLQANLGV